MPRVKRGQRGRRRRKKILKQAKGYWGKKSKALRSAKEAVDKALKYAYRDRRVRKREFRGLWIIRLNAAAREHGLSYSKLISGIKRANIEIDRKMLSEIAQSDPTAFANIVTIAREHI